MNSGTPKAKRNAQNKSTSISIVGDTTGNIIVGDSNVIGYTSEKVAELLTQINKTFQPKPFNGRCPYKGLDVFEEEDADLFFGREKLVKELVGRVNESRTVFITGPSGSGKSSLVRAGLIHSLKQGAIKNSDKWLYESIKPGRNPFEALAFAFSRLKSPELGKYFSQNIHQPNVLDECAESALSERKDQRLVLFIDQFEEIFTQVSKDITEAFIQLITNSVTKPNGRVIILFCMRSDFIPNCATYPELNRLLNQQFIQIGAMQAEELVSAIAQPALRVGLRIDPDLIAQIINDMKGEPGALPLMQFALKDLFDDGQSKGGVIALTLDAYLGHGGIQKSLERHADAAFGKLEKHEQELARNIFSGLIEIGRGTQDTRRTALFEELIPASTNENEVEAIVQKLADARLVTTDEQAGKDTITISHEKLIDAWPWLRKLVNENREVIALQNEINNDAKEWEEHKRDVSYLYRGAKLTNVQGKLDAKKIILSNLASNFIKIGIRTEENERLKEKVRLRTEQVSRQRLVLVVILITLSVIATLAYPYILRAMAQGEMEKIASGNVIIGTNDPDASEEEQPEWEINLNEFFIDRYEVSNYQYHLCMLARGGCEKPIKNPTILENKEYRNYPVTGVTAFQADAFCRWLGKRLPTELEWERVARGPNGRDWPWGNENITEEHANLTFDDMPNDIGLQPVDSFSKGKTFENNIYNLIGNVWEWTSSYQQSYKDYNKDLYWDSLHGSPIDGLVIRGGAWNDNFLTRVTYRGLSVTADDVSFEVGIRCAKDA